MIFDFLYKIGVYADLNINSPLIQKKLSFILFKYTGSQILSTSLILLISGVLFAYITSSLNSFLSNTLLFTFATLSILVYVYPVQIIYNNKIMEYSEEMLKAIMHLSTFIQTKSSMEYAFIQTQNSIEGILQIQFQKIVSDLNRKKYSSLGDAMKQFVPIWNEVNPQFVKGIRLLQIASVSKEEDRKRLVEETIDTLILNYQVIGKRSAEELSKNTKLLLGAGLLLPIISLLIIPVLAVFMPQLITPNLLAFLYVICFPILVLVASLSFASKRIQIDTINLSHHKKYVKMSSKLIYLSLFISVLFAVPAIPAIIGVLEDPSGTLNNFWFFFYAWFACIGFAIAVKIYVYIYIKKNKKLWYEIQEIEQDIPFVLQSFSTYYSLNAPFEGVIGGIAQDYEQLGFKQHPVVSAFKKLKNRLLYSKKDSEDVLKKELNDLFPTKKFRNIINQIHSFEKVNQVSASKAARTIREQVLNTYKLDDYIRTLLSDTVGLIKVSANMLAPILCASAVVMTYAILKSTDFITQQLERVTSVLGGDGLDLTLIDTSEVISPIFISLIVGIYLVFMTVILSIFQTQISTGNDKYKIFESINDNLISFVVYSVMLFVGYYFVNEVLFNSILA